MCRLTLHLCVPMRHLMSRSVVVVLAAALLAGCSDSSPTGSDPSRETFAAALGIDLAQMQRTPGGVYYRDDRVGTGAQLTTTGPVRVRYIGWLRDGTMFDSSPSAQFPLSSLIPGWGEGMLAAPAMRVGGIRRVVIPSRLGYGSEGRAPSIPRNATLVFEIELLGLP
jgi:FKBP-type peptidyl-prolyl cis-trans isomerase FkpA